MRIVHCRDMIVVRAPAKVNLFLEILSKRTDGYHEIATLMVAIRLMDTLILQGGCQILSLLQSDRALHRS